MPYSYQTSAFLSTLCEILICLIEFFVFSDNSHAENLDILTNIFSSFVKKLKLFNCDFSVDFCAKTPYDIEKE